MKTTRCITRFVENNITQVRSQALFMSGASKFHTWKFSWFERLIYFFLPHMVNRSRLTDELCKATCVTNTRVTEYSVYHLFLLLLSSRSILGVRKKNCIPSPVRLNRSKKICIHLPVRLNRSKKICIRSAVRLYRSKKICIRLLAVRSVVQMEAVRNIFCMRGHI